MDEQASSFALETFLPYRLVRIAEQVSQDFAAIYRKRYGLSRPEWRCLAALGQFGTITAKEIVAHSAMHKTKVSRAVAELDRRGWLERQPDTEDRRMEKLRLTAAGRRAFRNIVPLADEFERALRADLGNRATEQILAGLEAFEKRLNLPPYDT